MLPRPGTVRLEDAGGAATASGHTTASVSPKPSSWPARRTAPRLPRRRDSVCEADWGLGPGQVTLLVPLLAWRWVLDAEEAKEAEVHGTCGVFDGHPTGFDFVLGGAAYGHAGSNEPGG
jgi:hypothetical protein